MTISDFERQMNRLKSTFGDRQMSDDKTRIFWEHYRELPVAVLSQAVDFWLAEGKSAPRLSDLQSASSSVARQTGRSYCGSCMSGWVLGPYGSAWANTAMRCDCMGGVRALADRIRNHPESADPKRADEMERSFAGIANWEWAAHGGAARQGVSK